MTDYLTKLEPLKSNLTDLFQHIISYIVDPFLSLQKENLLDYFVSILCKQVIGNVTNFQRAKI